MTEKNFGDRLTQLREGKGYLQRDVAFHMNVKPNTISNWEKGISRPNLDQLCQLCQIFNVTSDMLLGLDKSAMKQTLNLKEQRIVSVYRSLDNDMQDYVYQTISGFGQINEMMLEKCAVADSAEQFIKSVGLKDNWEKCLCNVLLQDNEEDKQEGNE